MAKIPIYTKADGKQYIMMKVNKKALLELLPGCDGCKAACCEGPDAYQRDGFTRRCSYYGQYGSLHCGLGIGMMPGKCSLFPLVIDGRGTLTVKLKNARLCLKDGKAAKGPAWLIHLEGICEAFGDDTGKQIERSMKQMGFESFAVLVPFDSFKAVAGACGSDDGMVFDERGKL